MSTTDLQGSNHNFEATSFSSLNTHQQAEENEKQMIKYEADIRQHISIEQQLQVYIDSLKQKIEDMEKEQSVIHEANLEIMAENEKAKAQINDQAEMID